MISELTKHISNCFYAEHNLLGSSFPADSCSADARVGSVLLALAAGLTPLHPATLHCIGVRVVPTMTIQQGYSEAWEVMTEAPAVDV